MVERGTAGGPAASSSSARPMQPPALWPMQGMPWISGTSGLAAVVWNSGGAVGTRNGVQVVVKVSLSSPEEHWASGAPDSGAAKAAIVGEAAAVTMNPPMSSRRSVKAEVVIPRV